MIVLGREWQDNESELCLFGVTLMPFHAVIAVSWDRIEKHNGVALRHPSGNIIHRGKE